MARSYGSQGHAGITLLLLLFSSLAIYFALMNPRFEAPEEGLHFTVARDIASGRLPLLTTRFASIGEEHQPRLYYLYLAPVVGWADGSLLTWVPSPAGLSKGPALALLGARLLTIIMGVGALLCTYLTVMELFRQRWLALAVTATQALVPGFILTSSTVNNDSATNLFSALALLLGTKVIVGGGTTNWRLWACYVVAVAAAAGSKLTGLFILPYFVATIVIAFLTHDSRRTRVALSSALFVAIAIIAGSAVLDPNSRISLTARVLLDGNSAYSLSNVVWSIAHISPDKLLDLGGNLARTALTIPGWQQSEPATEFLYYTAALAVLLSGVGIVRYACGNQDWSALPKQSKLALLLLMAALLTVIVELFVVQWGNPSARHYWGIAHSRYLFPVGGAVALLLVGGLAALVKGRFHPLPTVLLAAALVTLDVSSGFYRDWDTSGPLLSRAASPAMTAANATFGVPTPVSFSSGITLLEYQSSPDSLWPSGTLRVRMLWRADRDLREDIRSFVHVVSHSGEAVAKQDMVPTGHRLPTRVWRQGDEVLDDRYVMLPVNVAPGRYRIEVGVYGFGTDNTVVPSTVVGQGISPDGLRLLLGYVQVLQPAISVEQLAVRYDIDFGGELRLVGSDSSLADTTVRDGIVTSLYWTTEHQLVRDYVISLQVVDSSGRLVAQHDGQPQGGSYPTSIWKTGEVVRDERRISAPGGLPHGVYTINALVYTLPEISRLRVNTGASAGQDEAQVGTAVVTGSVEPDR